MRLDRRFSWIHSWMLAGTLGSLATAGCTSQDSKKADGEPKDGSSQADPKSESPKGSSNQDTTETGETSDGETDDGEAGEDAGQGPKFDMGAHPKAEQDTGGPDCEEKNKHEPCDAASNDPLHALGINCPGESPQIQASFQGAPASRGVLTKLGNTNTFNPREGSKYLILGTGLVEEVSQDTKPSDSDASPRLCNKEFKGGMNNGQALPPPLKTNRVGDVDCEADPSLVGTGDCSNTIEEQWLAGAPSNGKGARDYAELRLKMTVPEWANSLAYDFAFFTVEYPVFYQRIFNDFFVAWLESKKWTGNISFDKQQNPISLNAGFLDFRDAVNGTPNDPDCKDGCKAPELHGSCFRTHAGTNWLTTKVGVTPGEEIELVFAIFDLGDARLDSYVILDNFRWGCDPQGKPQTDPPQ